MTKTLLLSLALVYSTQLFAQFNNEQELAEIKANVEQTYNSRWQISGDGKYILQSLVDPDIETNSNKRRWYITKFDGELVKKLASDLGGQVSWVPGSQDYWTTSTAESGSVITRYSLKGKVKSRTYCPKAASYYWLPKQNQVLCVVLQQSERPSFGNFELIGESKTTTHFYIAKEGAKKARLIYTMPFALKSGAPSLDGKHFAFIRQNNGLSQAYYNKIELLDVSSGKSKIVVDQYGDHTRLLWQDDGKAIAFSSKLDKTISNSPYSVFVVDVESNKLTALTSSFDNWAFPVHLSASAMLFEGVTNMERGLFRLERSSQNITKIDLKFPFILNPDVATDNPALMVFRAAKRNQRSYIYTLDLNEMRPTKLLAEYYIQPDWSAIRTETVNWKSVDGLDMHGVLYKSANFEPNKRYPLIVDIHGGPRAQDYPVKNRFEVSPTMLAVKKGALLFKVNYRGSIGRGDAFIKAHHRTLGQDAQDVIEGVAHLIKQGFVDPKRVLLQGWSYGGFIAAWSAVLKETPYNAIIMGAGISDWRVHYAQEAGRETTREFSFGATPWQDPEAYAKHSPITYAHNANTPTLIIHGKEDPIVTISNAYQMFHALRDNKVPVRFLQFNKAGHWASANQDNYAQQLHTWQWLKQYLWDEEFAVPLALDH